MIPDSIFAKRTERMGASAIREILKVVARPGMVSLAGGIPSPQAFPMDRIAELASTVLDNHGTAALQYGTTEGYRPLREQLALYLATLGIAAEPDEITVTSGSQGLLDNVAKVTINKGDVIAVEAPTYLGALQAFTPYEPTYVEMETDDNGVIPASVREVIETHRPKFVYLVPTFQNPTGRTIPLDRRKEIASIVGETNTLVIEDDPYGQLRYSGEFVPPIKSFAPDHVVYGGSFSKVFAPGIRLGFNVAPKALREWMIKAKQGVDLHTSSFSQALATEFLRAGMMENHLPRIIELYRPRLQAMINAMVRSFPASFTWTKPEGGMFVWAVGPDGFDATEFYRVATEQYSVAYVPGTYFFAKPGTGVATMRLNFTMSDEETLAKAVETLGGAIRAFLE